MIIRAVLLSPLLVAAAGCAPRVPLRPDGSPGPEECPKEARQAMAAMMMNIDSTAAVQIDPKQWEQDEITLYDGAIESKLATMMGNLDPGTTFVGKVWTAGPQVVIRYYEARSPFWGPLPICVVLRAGPGMLRKLPESKPGSAVISTPAGIAVVVDAFR